jgi:hypothetical protein
MLHEMRQRTFIQAGMMSANVFGYCPDYDDCSGVINVFKAIKSVTVSYGASYQCLNKGVYNCGGPSLIEEQSQYTLQKGAWQGSRTFTRHYATSIPGNPAGDHFRIVSWGCGVSPKEDLLIEIPPAEIGVGAASVSQYVEPWRQGCVEEIHCNYDIVVSAHAQLIKNPQSGKYKWRIASIANYGNQDIDCNNSNWQTFPPSIPWFPALETAEFDFADIFSAHQVSSDDKVCTFNPNKPDILENTAEQSALISFS